MSNSARKIRRAEGRAIEAKANRKAVGQAPGGLPGQPSEPKRFIISVPLKRVKLRDTDITYEASRIVNGRFKKNISGKSHIADSIVQALAPYLAQLEQSWADDTDVMVNLVIEKEVEDNSLESFLSEGDEDSGTESEVESGDGAGQTETP